MKNYVSEEGLAVSDMLFMNMLRCALENTTPPPSLEASPEEWIKAFELARIHKVLPLIADVYARAPFSRKENLATLSQIAKVAVTQQVVKTADFLSLYSELYKKGVTPVTVKGIICRQVYPKPDLRVSADEDMYVLPEDTLRASRLLTEQGMKPLLCEGEDAEQCAYCSENGLYIELHKYLFPCDSYFEKYNKIFANAFDRSVFINVDGIKIRTLSPTDHLLYLILHSAKHFLHSGVGIRQVCDIVMFSHFYGKDLDWDYIYRCCKETDTLYFAAALLDIGTKHLGLSLKKASIPQSWQNLQVSGDMLLEDILDAGIYGSSTPDRSHSAGITLSAVKGTKQKIMRTVFPSAKDMGAKFTYVKKCPLLLPIAWGQRLMGYSKEVAANPKSTPANALKTGQKRLELLKAYKFKTD